MKKTFLAIDLGATSGRSIVGSVDNGIISMQELTRFPNTIKKIRDHYFWNIFDLFEEIKIALATCAKDNINVDSIGIDTWGVDFAMVGEDGMILGLPYAYRDPHTEGMPEDYFKNVLSRDKVYGITGIQIMNFNSLFQIYAMKKENSSMLKAADKLLFIPDALSYLLTGNAVTEYTIASTSQILNPFTKEMDNSLLKAIGIERNLFHPIVFPGAEIGRLRDDIAKETGVANIPVVAVAGHDTASAVAAVPAKNERFAYLSSGTWSLMGIETKDPIINEQSMQLNFTNEGGVDGTTRFLKNITGMWILEQCRKEWDKDVTYAYPELVAMANSAEPFKCMIDPDHPSFANPESMEKAIVDYCEATGQKKPETHSEFVRMIFESLALKYRVVLEMLKSVAPFEIEVLHVIGGGSKNDLLNQFTANAIGIPVISGPSEATAIGNIMIQAQAAGIVDSLQEMRNIIAGSIDSKEYQPQQPELWDEAFMRYKNTCNL
ncbi:MAG: rhamnulokinase [Rikenellaceae bacterium]|nr:rhamnulokinase [Rikenellaceae bacterium]